MCWFCHKWGKWEQYLWQGSITTRPLWKGEPKTFQVKELRQRRVCEKCGEMQDVEV